MAFLGPWHGGSRRGGGGWESPYFSPSDWDYGGGGGITNWRRGGGVGGSEYVAALAHANVDWHETDKAHIFCVDLPGAGVRKEDLKVQLEDKNSLLISGDRVVEREEEDDKWHRVERRRGSFLRRFRLPENADVDGMRCGLEHGVLTVEVPKKEVQEQPRSVRYIDIA